MIRNALLAVLAASTLEACVSSESPTGSEQPSGSTLDAGSEVIDVDGFANKALGRLTREEASALCREDERRWDPCLAVALVHEEPAECEESLAACRSQAAGSGAWGCERSAYPGLRECDVTVEEYLACVDAWNEVFVCDGARYRILTPDACESVVARCPVLEGEFTRAGNPPPCDPFTGEAVPDTNDDVVGADGCRPIPARFVVLGDSIAECWLTAHENCGPYLVFDELVQHYAPDARFETHAVSGAVTADLPGQALEVEGGPGHVAVWVWAIGNDLLMRSTDLEAWERSWQEVFDTFTDRQRFPDGVTFMLNSQYSPADECVPEDADREAFLREVNRRLFLDVAEARPDTVAIDQYADWLGHGALADVQGCPHCGVDNTGWMFEDGLHPSDLGHVHIAEKWSVALEAMYGGSCLE